MPLNEYEKERARYHLGWPSLTALAGISLGVPGADQLLSILDRNLNHLQLEAEPGLRRALQELDCIEDEMTKARRQLGIVATGTTRLDYGGALDMQLEQYAIWAEKLAIITATPVNPYSDLHRRAGAGSRGGVVESW